MSELIIRHTADNITTLTMNMPKRLNGWTKSMLEALQAALREADADPETRAIILTGTDPYYSAGVNLGAAVKPMSPKALLAFIERENRALFDAFLDLETPILAAINGPAIGACVTSATLCDGIMASSEATFSTPFARLGVTPEGCSSVLFPRLIGDAAERMLGSEGFKPSAQEALDIGLVQWVVPHERLLDEARRVAGEWVAAGAGRTFRAGLSREELKAINAEESKQLAMAFLSPPFLMGQFRFLWGKGKRSMALMFLAVRTSRPLWRLLL